jgi:hypothetical protein
MDLMDTEITIPVVDGDTDDQNVLAVSNGAGGVAAQTAIRSNGAFVSEGNPLPTQSPPAVGAYSTVAEAFHILKALPGVLSAVSVNSSVTGWVLLIDSPTLPANGAVAPRRAWAITAGVTLDKTFNPPLQISTGAVLAFSSTGPFLLTIGAAVAQFAFDIV